MFHKRSQNHKESGGEMTAKSQDWHLGAPLSKGSGSTQVVDFAQFQSAGPESGLWQGGNLAVLSPLPKSLPAVKINVGVGILFRIRQDWNRQAIRPGDLVSVISLAPNETVQVTVSKSTKRSIERSRENATQIENSTELTITDRESLDVVQTAARQSQWNVSGNIGFRVPNSPLSGGIQSNQSSSAQSSTSKTVGSIHEQVGRSSSLLRTQTKVSVTVREEVLQTEVKGRMLHNPSNSNMLHLWGYEVIKQFQVTTRPTHASAALRIGIEPFAFDDEFVATQGEFLSASLIDSSLNDVLDSALAAARAKCRSVPVAGADLELSTAESLLFWDGLVTSISLGGTDGETYVTPWDLSKDDPYYLKPLSAEEPILELAALESDWALDEYKKSWVGMGLGQIFISWRAMFLMRRAVQGTPEREYWLANKRRLLDKFGSLCRKVAWDSTDLQAMFMPHGATHVLARRIVSFLFLTSFGSSDGATDDGMASDDETQDLQSLSALRHHLTAFGDLYTSLWLKWVEKTNGRKLLGRLINRVLSDVRGDSADGPGATAFLPFRDWYDLQDVVVDDCEILVPIREKILEESVPALEDLVVSSMIFNQRLLGKGEEEVAAKQAAVAAQFAKAGMQGTQSPGTVPGSSGAGTAMDVSKSTGQGGQVGSIYQWEAAQAKQASTTQQAWVNKPIDSELVTKYSLLQIDLGDPTSMAQSSSVEVVAEGMYVKGRFDAC
jgi:hypothetical protein